jgi:hypothetical protein
MAMNQYAISLVNQAWDMFQGHEPAPEQGFTIRDTALIRAQHEIGVIEDPPNSNNVKYAEWYGMNGQPWCAMFVTWCYVHAALDLDTLGPTFKQGSYYAYVPYVVGDARSGMNELITTDDPQPGDLVCYDWNWDGEYDHIGIFEKWVDSEYFQTVEGNTSPANYSNGGMVMRCQRSKSSQGTVFCRAIE